MDVRSVGRQARGRCLRGAFTARSCADDSEQGEGPLLHKAGIRRVYVGGPRFGGIVRSVQNLVVTA